MSVTALPRRSPTVTVEAAPERFLTQPDLGQRTVQAYAAALTRFAATVGADRELATVTAEEVEAHLAEAYGQRSAAYYNRNRAAISGLFAFGVRKRWVVGNPVEEVVRRRQRAVVDRGLRLEELQAAWTDPDVPLRERCLWVMLYETAARASEILALNVEDLDLAERSARITAKGGGEAEVFWATSTARLLDRYLDGRQTGPVFVAERRPTQAQPARDVSPNGYARLSYRRAQELLQERTGWTLHQLRHSALTHLAEGGVDVTLLKAKSRHKSLRSLEVYVHPTRDAVRELTADHDRVRRGR